MPGPRLTPETVPADDDGVDDDADGDGVVMSANLGAFAGDADDPEEDRNEDDDDERADTVALPGPWGRAWLLAPLKSGGTGQVFLATLEDDEGLVALKRQRPSLHLDIGDVLLSAKRLEGKHIRGVADVVASGVHDGFGWVASAYCAGVDAQTLMDHAHSRGERLPLEVALAVSTAALKGLEALHAQRLVHRDVSPGNIMVGRDGAVCIVDVDFVVATGTAATDTVPGTVSCMSPEQAQGLPVDGRADLYAWAIVTYELVVGDTFYGDLPMTDIWSLARTGGYRPRRHGAVPAWLWEVLAAALAPDASLRPADATMLLGRLADAAAAAGATVASAAAVAAVVEAVGGAQLDALAARAKGGLLARSSKASSSTSPASDASSKRASSTRSTSTAADALLRATVELKGGLRPQHTADDKSASVMRPRSADSALGFIVATTVILLLLAVLVLFDPLGLS
jgi:serine/threonine protein kinase